ncbi:MAG: HAMP domain-containing sensor histidine kinase [Candidatus Thermoplasmatota archaeon]|nr:HAMP domain-containing sensor histidine kinase [Candidatus Thermoplasmatota archaeon]
MMNADILAFINFIFSIAILIFVLKVYSVYKRAYILWFILSLSIVPFIFIYDLIWSSHGSPLGIVVYPVSVIIVELGIIIAQKNLISSIKSGEGEEYKMLLRDDVAILRSYEQLANFFIDKIAPLIGTNSIKELLESRIDKHPLLAGSYISVDERLNTKAIEEVINKLEVDDLSQAFYDLVSGLIELYSAFVPWEKAIDESRKAIGRVIEKNFLIFDWIIPIVLFRTVLEPVLRKCRPEDIKEIAILLNRSNSGVEIGKNGKIDIAALYRQYPEKNKMDFIIQKFLDILNKTYLILQQSLGEDNVNSMITMNFRKMPTNIKEKLYGEGMVEKLPRGVLEEEKVTLMSREMLVEELVERRKKLEKAYRELAEAELGKMKTTFLDVVAHELRTPLTSIKTYVELFKREKLGKLTKVQKEKLDIMAKNVDKLTNLINDMLQIPSIDVKELELRKEKFFTREVVEEVIEDCKEISDEKKQCVSIKIPTSSTLKGDKNLFGKAIKNILVNAIRYTPPGGKIKISARADGEKVHLRISDNGAGIPEDEIDRIFDPFYTGDNKNGGMGLGLSIVKNIIEGHGGKVWAESKVGRGSTFHLLIPGEGK